MLESPPAIVVTLPDVPAGFSLEAVERGRTSTAGIFAPGCPASGSDEIIVCGRRRNLDRYRLGPPLSDNPALIESVSDSLSWKVGSVEIGSLKQTDGTRRFGLRTKF